MIARRLIITFIVASLAFSIRCRAQDNNLHFINFSSKDGLSSNSINAILKDSLGFMWFGSDDGLSKFDGTRFTVYNHNPTDSTSIISNNIMALYEDKRGNLWVGTGKGLSLYDRKKDAFQNFNVTLGTTARAITADHSGNLWIGGYSGLFKFNPATGRSTYYSAEDGGKSHLTSSTVLCIFEDSHRRLWVGTNAGLHLYQQATDNFIRFSGQKSDSTISSVVIKSITEDRSGDLWIGTMDGGLNRLPHGGTGFHHYKSIAGDAGTLSSNRLFSLAFDENGKLWIGTEKGLDIFDPQTGKVQRITADARDRYSLKGSSVRSIYIDKRGIYWVAAYQSGVNKYDKNLTFFNLVQSNPFDPLGLSAPKVTSFAETRDGNIYVGTDGGGLHLYKRNSGLINKISIGREPLTILAMETVGNDLWIGTFMQGIYVLNTTNGVVRHYRKDDGVSGLCSDEIFCIRKDRNGNVWIGTNGMGVQVLARGKKNFQDLEDHIAGSKGDKPPANGFIRAIEEDSKGKIWIAAPGRGVDMFDPIEKNFRIYGRSQTGMPIADVLTLKPGKNGILWVGTGSAGICRLDFRNSNFRNFSTGQGLINEVVLKILEDSSGVLWLSTNKGISCFNPSKTIFKNFTHENGLQRSAFILGAGLQTPDGEMFFGGLEGFNHFLPGKLNYNMNVPVVVFTGLTVDNNRVVPGRRDVIDANIGEAREIRLNYKENFSIDFAVLDFTSPHECQFMYLLEGFNNGWNLTGGTRTAVFTNLDPGKYTLLVKAYNSNSGWTTPATSISVYIKPPFYRTGYAYVFYILVAGLTLWGLRYRSIRRLKQKFANEQERRQIRQLIEDERKEAERQRAFDEVKIKFLTNLSHEFRTPISLIVGPVQTLLDSESDQNKKEQLSMVKRNSRRLLNLVNQLLDFRKLEERETRLSVSAGEIVGFVREVAETFRDLADRRHIQFHFNSSLKSYHTCFDKDKIERVLFNVLSNAFKFTGRDGEVSLMIRQDENGGIMISIADNGIGMSQEEQDHIFDRFFQGETHPAVMNKGSGIGLSITKEFIKLHGGSIHVESLYGKGSVFTIRLPLEKVDTPMVEVATQNQSMPDAMQSLQVQNEVAGAAGDDLLTVLLIEDNEDFRIYLRNNLKPYYKVIEAVDGREGWQKALSGHPHVIVSDISMPYMDGIALSKKIKADKRTMHIPIILLTALTGDSNQLNGLQTGASDYLTKPFSAEILKVKIRNLAVLNQRFKDTYSRRLEVVTKPVAVESENEKLLIKIASYIESNIDDTDLSVEQLAKYLCISRATLYNKVIDLTGETPVEFIRSVRLKKAAELLETSDLRVSEIGYTVGFPTPNYFARVFKVKFNMSPSEYAAMKKRPTG